MLLVQHRSNQHDHQWRRDAGVPGGERAQPRRARKSTSWGREERHWWLGWEQNSGTCVEVASATTLLSPGARETGNESTVEVDVTNGAGEAGCRTTKAALLGPGRMVNE